MTPQPEDNKPVLKWELREFCAASHEKYRNQRFTVIVSSLGFLLSTLAFVGWILWYQINVNADQKATNAKRDVQIQTIGDKLSDIKTNVDSLVKMHLDGKVDKS